MATMIKHACGVYYIVFYKNGKRIWRTLSTRDRNLAHKRFIEYEKGGLSGPNSFPSVVEKKANKPPDVTLQQAVDEYLLYAKANLSTNTCRDYTSVTKLASEFLGPDTPIRQITTRDIERYKISKNNGKLSPHTINHDLRSIKAFFNLFVRWSLIEKNPCRGVKLLRTDDTIRPYLQRDELQKLLAYTAGSFLHSIIVFAILTVYPASETYYRSKL